MRMSIKCEGLERGHIRPCQGEDQRPWGRKKLGVFKDQKEGLYGWNTVKMRRGYKLGLLRAKDLVGHVEIYISFYT